MAAFLEVHAGVYPRRFRPGEPSGLRIPRFDKARPGMRRARAQSRGFRNIRGPAFYVACVVLVISAVWWKVYSFLEGRLPMAIATEFTLDHRIVNCTWKRHGILQSWNKHSFYETVDYIQTSTLYFPSNTFDYRQVPRSKGKQTEMNKRSNSRE